MATIDKNLFTSSIKAYSELSTAEEVSEHFLDTTQKMGFEFALTTRVPFCAAHLNILSLERLGWQFNNFPPEWMKRYIDKNYVREDSATDYVLRHQEQPFYWKQAISQFDNGSFSQTIWLEAKKAGLHHGATVSVKNQFGFIDICSLAGAEDDKDFYSRYDESLFMIIELLKVTGATLSKFIPVTLTAIFTDKQLQVLKWLTEGKTRVDIASLLAISVSGVDDHTSAIFKKLNARNAPQACSLAARYRLFDK